MYVNKWWSFCAAALIQVRFALPERIICSYLTQLGMPNACKCKAMCHYTHSVLFAHLHSTAANYLLDHLLSYLLMRP